tara:strand:+ start:881 stop:1270 length:390 start_codon:yes stop_codon:yes gene_type:complete
MMKKIEEIRTFNVKAEEIWEIIGDISRCDWVPGVESIELDEDKRIFKMAGMGDLVEKIIERNDKEMRLIYSAIKTMAPINHHLAQIDLKEEGDKTLFNWSTEIDPPNFAEAIRAGMIASLDKLEELLAD